MHLWIRSLNFTICCSGSAFLMIRLLWLFLILLPAGYANGQNAYSDSDLFYNVDAEHRLDRPAGRDGYLEGNWLVERRGIDDPANGKNYPDGAYVQANKGLKIDSECPGANGRYRWCRDPDAPWATQLRFWDNDPETGVRVTGGYEHFWIRPRADGTIVTPYSTLQRVSKDALVGTWTIGSRSGIEIWRRSPPAEIKKVTCNLPHSVKAVQRGSAPCRFELPFSSIPPKGAMRGNLPSIKFEILGNNLWGRGPVPIWLPKETHLEVGDYCYLYERGSKPSNDPPCTSWGDNRQVYGDIVGVRVSLNIIPGFTPGKKTLFLRDQPVPFDLSIVDVPMGALVAAPPANLDGARIRVLNSDARPIAEIVEGANFRVEAVFPDNRSDDWVAAEMLEIAAPPTDDASSEPSPDAVPRTLVLWQAAGPKTYLSEPLALVRIPGQAEEDLLSFAMTEPGFLPEASAQTTARLAGTWRVKHVDDSGETLSGKALVATDGRSVKLELTGASGPRHFSSNEVFTQAEPVDGQQTTWLKARLEETVPPNSTQGAPGDNMLLVKRAIPSVAFSLGNARQEASIKWRIFENERLLIDLSSSDPAKLGFEGLWHEEKIATASLGARGYHAWARPKPTIDGVIVLENQLTRADRTPNSRETITYEYPFSPDGVRTEGYEWRTLFVYGKDLPESAAATTLSSPHPAIEYIPFVGSSGTADELLERGWQKARSTNGSARHSDSALLVRARLKKGVLPGTKRIGVNDADHHWPLLFADGRALLRFVKPGGDAATNSTNAFYISEAGFVELDFETKIPLTGVAIRLYKESVRTGSSQVERTRVGLLLAVPVANQDGTIFRTQPLHFVDRTKPTRRPPDDDNASVIDVREGDTLVARLYDPAEAVVLPRVTRVRILGTPDDDDPAVSSAALGSWGPLTAGVTGTRISPRGGGASDTQLEPALDGRSPVWEKALRRVAACTPGKFVTDKQLRDGSFAMNPSGKIDPLILTSLKDNSISISNGTHAALILIRDQFVEMGQKRLKAQLERVNTPAKLRDYILGARQSKVILSDPFWQHEVEIDPIGKVKMLVLLAALENSLRLSDKLNLSLQDTKDFALRTLEREVQSYTQQVQSALKRAADAKDCNVAELLVVAGQKADVVVAQITPKLVKMNIAENPRREFWAPDTVAQAYLRGAKVAGAAVRGLKALQRVDDAYKMAAVFLTGAGGAALVTNLGGSAIAAGTVMMSADAVDLGVFGTSAVMDYLQGEDGYQYALGASSIMGNELIADAQAARQDPWLTALSVALPGVTSAFQLRYLRDLAKIKNGEALFMARPGIADDIKSLSPEQSGDLAAYFTDLSSRQSRGEILAATETAGLEKFRKFLQRQGQLVPGKPRIVAGGEEVGIRTRDTEVIPTRSSPSSSDTPSAGDDTLAISEGSTNLQPPVTFQGSALDNPVSLAPTRIEPSGTPSVAGASDDLLDTTRIEAKNLPDAEAAQPNLLRPTEDLPPLTSKDGPPVDPDAFSVGGARLADELTIAPPVSEAGQVIVVPSVPAEGALIAEFSQFQPYTGRILLDEGHLLKEDLVPGVRIVDDTTGEYFALGKQLNEGTFSRVFEDGTNSAWVIKRRMVGGDYGGNGRNTIHDAETGYALLSSTPSKNKVYEVVERSGNPIWVADPANNNMGYLLTREKNIAEDINGTIVTNARDRFAARGYAATREEALTMNLAVRELNQRGIVWTDNKLANIDIVPGDSPTGYKVLFFDFDAFRPVKGASEADRWKLAREVQRAYDGISTKRRAYLAIAKYDDAFDYKIFGRNIDGSQSIPPLTISGTKTGDGYTQLNSLTPEEFSKQLKLLEIQRGRPILYQPPAE
jgi:hypothetical protein